MKKRCIVIIDGFGKEELQKKVDDFLLEHPGHRVVQVSIAPTNPIANCGHTLAVVFEVDEAT